ASHVIHFDHWWNPAVEDQATDRAYRIGQTKKVFVYRLLAAGTLEDRIMTMVSKKRSLQERAVTSGPEAWLTEMSTEELRDLVSLSSNPAGGEQGRASTSASSRRRSSGNAFADVRVVRSREEMRL
ncbi:unnamed protein product, partial [Amoebophrya sp. A25]